MVERVRSITIRIDVETTKRTIREEFDTAAKAIAWLKDNGYFEWTEEELAYENAAHTNTRTNMPSMNAIHTTTSRPITA